MRPLVLIACLVVSGWLQAGEQADVEKLLTGVAAYREGQSRAALVQLTKAVAEASKDPGRSRALGRRGSLRWWRRSTLIPCAIFARIHRRSG